MKLVQLELTERGFRASHDGFSAEGQRVQEALGRLFMKMISPLRLRRLHVEQMEPPEGQAERWRVVGPSNAGFSWDSSLNAAIGAYGLLVGMSEDSDIFNFEGLELPSGFIYRNRANRVEGDSDYYFLMQELMDADDQDDQVAFLSKFPSSQLSPANPA